MFTNNALVAFIDLLGFGDHVTGILDGEQFAATVRTVENIQRIFSALPSEFDLEAQRAVGKEVLAFSDSIISVLPLDTDYVRSLGDKAVLTELCYLAYSQFQCVQLGHFVRGGMDTGAWFHHENIIVSPPMVAAARLEKDVCVPVIGLPKELYDALVTADAEEANRVVAVTELQSPLLPGKSKTLFYIDYLRLTYEAEANSDEVVRIHSRSIQQALINAGNNEKVLNKYRWLVSYHNTFVDKYSLNEALKIHVT